MSPKFYCTKIDPSLISSVLTFMIMLPISESVYSLVMYMRYSKPQELDLD